MTDELIPFGDIQMWTVRRVFGTSEHALAQQGPDFARLLVEAPIVALCAGKDRAMAVGQRIRQDVFGESLREGPTLVFHGIYRIGQPIFRGHWQAFFVMPMFFTENTEITRKVSPPKTGWRGLGSDLATQKLAELMGVIMDRKIPPPLVVESTMGLPSAGMHAQGGAIDQRVLRPGDTLTFSAGSINLTLS